MSHYPQYFAVLAHNTEKMWFWFCVTPRRIAYYPLGIISPSLGTTVLEYFSICSK